MTMWVWRLAHREVWAGPNAPQPRARFWQCCDWEIDEIYQHGRLRQGWATPELDLNLPREVWRENAVQSRIGVDDPRGQELGIQTRDDAEKAYNLLIQMRFIIQFDTIFLPNVGNNRRSRNFFTVLTVDAGYQFEDRNDQLILGKEISVIL